MQTNPTITLINGHLAMDSFDDTVPGYSLGIAGGEQAFGI